jgi:uncharacterized protein (TIGR03083 family)
MTDRLAALRSSTDHLHALVTGLDPDALRRPAYPTEWTVADVLSHLGSSAEIFRAGFDAAVAGGGDAPDHEAIWAAWNAKSPDRKAADALVVDEALTDAFESLPDPERAAFHATLGPLDVDFDSFVGLRINEHLLHTWDVEVAGDPDATLLPAAVPSVVDSLGMIARWSGRPEGSDAIRVQTDDPRRDLTVSLGPDAVALTTSDDSARPDLVLPAEAFVRLVYGRLDPDHTPPVNDAALVTRLRAVFPGP